MNCSNCGEIVEYVIARKRTIYCTHILDIEEYTADVKSELPLYDKYQFFCLKCVEKLAARVAMLSKLSAFPCTECEDRYKLIQGKINEV